MHLLTLFTPQILFSPRRYHNFAAHVALALLFSFSLAGARAHAQPVAGLGEDAIPVPKGGVRLVVGALWDQWDRRLGTDGTRSTLLSGLSTSALGVAQLPALAPAESGIRGLSGLPDFTLSLGSLEASGLVRRATTTFQAEVGIRRWLSVGVRIPYVEVKHSAELVLNRTGTSATVGANPGLQDPSAAIANGSVSVQLDAARTQLQTALSVCTDTDSSSLCTAIRADRSGATALVARTEQFRARWNSVYGDGASQPGAPVVPVQGGTVHRAIAASLATLRTDFERFFPTSIPTTGPRGALLVYGSQGLQTIAKDSAFGINADTLGGAFRAGMGDIDLEAKFLLFDSWRADQAARLNSGQSGVRAVAVGGWRFGSASSAQTNQPFALALGDGVNALLLRTTVDLVWRRRAWLSATVRSVSPMTDAAVVRGPGVGNADAFFGSQTQLVERSLGRQLHIELAPRLNLGDKFGVSATWRRSSFAEDQYAIVGGGEFVTPSRSMQVGAIGVSYSTLAAYVRGQSKWPVEVLFAHEVALSASGVAVPALVRDRLELRVYPGFPRR